MAGLSGIVKKISDLVTGTPADDDCFIFGKTDLKKITLAKLKDALGITSINSALAHLKCTGVADISGEKSITVDAGMSANNLYLIFLRQLNGSADVHPPCALLLYMRTENYSYSTLGELVDLQSTSIGNGRITFNWKTQQWVRVWVFKIS